MPNATVTPISGAAGPTPPARKPGPTIGLPAEAFEFYEALAVDNSRAWWHEHRAEHELYVRDPMVALLSALEEEFGAFHLFRPYRDTRFAKDKSPIKDHQGAIIE